MISFLNTGNKQDKRELPQWYQQSAMGQLVNQQQDKARQWFGDVMGMNPQTGMNNPLQPYIDPIQQYNDSLKQQAQNWFAQTPVGQGADAFRRGFMEPLQTRTDQTRQKYNAQLKSQYDNAMTKMGLL